MKIMFEQNSSLKRALDKASVPRQWHLLVVYPTLFFSFSSLDFDQWKLLRVLLWLTMIAVLIVIAHQQTQLLHRGDESGKVSQARTIPHAELVRQELIHNKSLHFRFGQHPTAKDHVESLSGDLDDIKNLLRELINNSNRTSKQIIRNNMKYSEDMINNGNKHSEDMINNNNKHSEEIIEAINMADVPNWETVFANYSMKLAKKFSKMTDQFAISTEVMICRLDAMTSNMSK